jgi:predicted enzyme related to lactoylglutathione lyase
VDSRIGGRELSVPGRSLPGMTERDSYPAGTPSWVDIGSPDPEVTAKFYGELFGWDVGAPGGPETGGYRMAMLKGRPVAGIGPAQAEGTPWWTTYVTVDDADATAKSVEAAGGKVIAAPFDVLTAGRMGIFSDPGGALFSVWQPIDHHGSGLVNEHGSLTWNELTTRHLDDVRPFYEKVFGWEASEHDMGGGTKYTVWNLDGTGIGGAVRMEGDQWPADLPDHWVVYFAVDDCDASVAKATELGGTVTMPPTSIPSVGRFAIVNGPHGEVLAVITNEQPAESNT